MTGPKWAPVDERVIEILERVKAADKNADDVALVVSAILAVADDEAGYVNPNLVRPRLQDVDDPHVVGAVYSALVKARVLVFAGWTYSDDRKSGNGGKPARIYYMAGWSTCSQ